VVLEKYLRQKGAVALKAQGQAVPAIDPDEYDMQVQARVPEKRGGRGWFVFGGKSKQADVESGDIFEKNRVVTDVATITTAAYALVGSLE
jgi:hypothetical protein